MEVRRKAIAFRRLFCYDKGNWNEILHPLKDVQSKYEC